jgi:hypothetical protein
MARSATKTEPHTNKLVSMTNLTDEDRQLIAQARKLAAARNHSGDLRAITRTEAAAPAVTVYEDALSVADYLLLELVAIIDRLAGQP